MYLWIPRNHAINFAAYSPKGENEYKIAYWNHVIDYQSERQYGF